MDNRINEGMLLYLYKNQRAFNNQKMKILFNGNILVNIGSHILINKDNFELNEIFEKIRDLNVGQFIFSGEKYATIIRYCILNNLSITEINHYEEIEIETLNYIEELLNELKRNDISIRLKETLIRSLLYELRYLEYENDNNISSIALKCPSGSNIILFNNNKISFNISDIEYVKKLILLFYEK